MSGPLRGKRVLNTRAVHQAAALDALLRAEGAIPVAFPCIGIEPLGDTSELDAALRAAIGGRFDWVVITSINTAQALGARFHALGHERLEGAPFRVAAIGTATATAVEQWLGRRVDFVPETQHAAALAAAFPIAPGKRVLLPASSKAGSNLAHALTARGAEVQTPIAYETVSVKPDTGIDLGRLLLDRAIDAIAFASPSAVDAFASRLQETGMNPSILSGVVIACIGPTTSRAANERRLPVPLIAREQSLSGLIDTLRNAFAIQTRREASQTK